MRHSLYTGVEQCALVAFHATSVIEVAWVALSARRIEENQLHIWHSIQRVRAWQIQQLHRKPARRKMAAYLRIAKRVPLEKFASLLRDAEVPDVAQPLVWQRVACCSHRDGFGRGCVASECG
jgi:hypothetical protein